MGIYFNEGDLAYLDKVELLICPEAKRFELFDDKKRVVDAVALSSNLKCTVVTTNLLGCESGSDIFDGLSIIADDGKLVSQSNYLSFKRADFVTASSGISEFLNEYDTIVRAVALGQFDWMLKTRSHGLHYLCQVVLIQVFVQLVSAMVS